MEVPTILVLLPLLVLMGLIGISQHYSYYVRLVQDPKRKSKYIVRKWHGVEHAFKSCNEMKSMLQDNFSDELPELTSECHVGYYEPPNGAKREDDRDLETMYKDRRAGSKINLWCEPVLNSTE